MTDQMYAEQEKAGMIQLSDYPRQETLGVWHLG